MIHLTSYSSSVPIKSGGGFESWDHVLQFPCKGKEGKHGRHHIFSRWQVGRDDK